MTSNVTRPAFVARFSCLGADCEDTCCRGWDMQLDATTYARYEAQAPELLSAVTGEAGSYRMKRDPASDYCIKLEGGLCGIQNKKGSDFLGDACYLYPRAVRTLGDQPTMTATLSCPEIARLTLFAEDAFTHDAAPAARLPDTLRDVLPEGLSAEQALAIHEIFLRTAIDEKVAPEESLMRIVVAVQSLMRVSVKSWPDAAPFYLDNAAASLPVPEIKSTDPVYLLQALCGLMAAAKKIRPTRLTQTIIDMERAMHVTIPWDTLVITPLPDCAYAVHALYMRWQKEFAAHYAPILRRYLTAQLSLALFPFAGFGGTLSERIAIIGIRFATIKLALMSACSLSSAPLADAEVVRIVQSLSRFLDHLADPEFSLKIYQETGWLKPARLRSLLEGRL